MQSWCSAKGSAASSFSGPGPVPMARSVETPAARARSSIASRSSANCGTSMCGCESISSIAEVLLSRGAACCAPTKKCLLQAGADFDVFVGEAGEDRAAFGAHGGGDDHAIGFHAAEFARREINDHGDFTANQFFRFVVLRDAGANLPNLGTDVHGELQQLVRAHNAFGGLDLADAHLDFSEVLDADFFGFGWGCRSGGSTTSSRGTRWRGPRGRNRRGGVLFFFFPCFPPLGCVFVFCSLEKSFKLCR